MPGVIEAITFIALSAQAGAIGAGIAGVVATFGGALLSIGASIGLSFLASSLFSPKQPRPEDVQQSTRQATAPRVRHYGRVKASGPWVFAESQSGNFHKVLAIGQGPIDAIEQLWIDDTQVTVDGSNLVNESPWTGKVLLETRLGVASETHYSSLASDFSDWTSDHTGDGVASIYAKQFAVSDANYLSTFPNGINTNYRVVLRGAQIENPVTSVTEWDDNAASVIRDYLTHADGMRLPSSIITTTNAQEKWETAFNRCDEDVSLKVGGTEDRYRLWGSYSLDERPADVLGRMLQCCDGRMVPTSDGGLALDIGDWSEPTVTLDEDVITGFSELGRGKDILSTANTIRGTFLNPNQDYQAAEADTWADASDVSDRGEIAQDASFNMAPSHSQCRRLMKLAAYRANPTWVGVFQCNLKALEAIDQRFVRVTYPKFSIDEVCEIQDFKFVIGEGGILVGVTLRLQSMPEAAYEWDAATEEGTAPVSDETDVSGAIPVPDPPTVSFSFGPVADLTFPADGNVLLFYEVRYKKTAGSEWTESGTLANDATSYTTGTLDAATEYEFQLRLVTEKGRQGDWSDSATATTP